MLIFGYRRVTIFPLSPSSQMAELLTRDPRLRTEVEDAWGFFHSDPGGPLGGEREPGALRMLASGQTDHRASPASAWISELLCSRRFRDTGWQLYAPGAFALIDQRLQLQVY